ncbi:MAG: cation diffusion facilitator family transporter [Candidatus Heimdallarchaeota archaeon]
MSDIAISETADNLRAQRMKKALIVTGISLVINLLLAVLKITFSVLSGSVSLLADGLDSALDIATTILGFVALRIADKPPDKDHQFGHEKFENLFSIGIAIILVASSFFIGYQAINKLTNPVITGFELYNVIIASVSIVLKGLLVWLNIRIGKQINSPSLIANGKNFRTDVLTSIVVLISVSIGHLSIGTFSLNWVDPSIALVIAVVIILTAVGIIREASSVLLDSSPNIEEIEKMKEVALKQDGVKGVGSIRARSISADKYLVDIDILLDPSITIDEGHTIATNVENALLEDCPVTYIQVHVEPFYEEKMENNTEEVEK